jgi:uncharacterized membrane protein YvbJ
MMFCSSCGSQMTGAAKFCSGCGAPTAEPAAEVQLQTLPNEAEAPVAETPLNVWQKAGAGLIIAGIVAMIALFIFNWILGLIALLCLSAAIYEWKKQQNVYLLNDALKAQRSRDLNR